MRKLLSTLCVFQFYTEYLTSFPLFLFEWYWAWVISHTKDNYLSAQYHRFVRRIGKKRAIVATSHSVLTIIYHLLRTGQPYHDLGSHYFQTLDTTRQRENAVRRLQALGYKVSLEELIEAPSPSSSSVPRASPSSKGLLDGKKE